MEIGNKKALVVAFYLSKYDTQAYANLGFGNASETHKYVGEQLGVKASSVKNMRDEFDPFHPNERVGWYQRPLRPSRQKVFDSFTELSELSLRVIVNDLLSATEDEKVKEVVTSINSSDESEIVDKTEGNTRGITGEQAERYFIDNWKKYYLGFTDIENKTKDGCGYDFKLTSTEEVRLIEVKGMKADKGGILLTDKEWKVANSEVTTYELFIVSNLASEPTVQIVKNIAQNFTPIMQVQTVLQVSWAIGGQQLTKKL